MRGDDDRLLGLGDRDGCSEYTFFGAGTGTGREAIIVVGGVGSSSSSSGGVMRHTTRDSQGIVRVQIGLGPSSIARCRKSIGRLENIRKIELCTHVFNRSEHTHTLRRQNHNRGKSHHVITIP